MDEAGLNGGPGSSATSCSTRTGSGWTETTPSGTGTTATIGTLAEDTEYAVQVLALNGETPSDWSPSGHRAHGRRVEHRTGVRRRHEHDPRGGREHGGQPVGAAVSATHARTRAEVHAGGRHAASFRIGRTTGRAAHERGAGPRGEAEPHVDGEGRRRAWRHGDDRRDGERHGRRRAAGGAGRADGVGGRGQRDEPVRALERAGEHGPAGDGLRPALQEDGRELDGRPGERDRPVGDDRRTGPGHGVRGAGAGAQRRGRKRLVAVGPPDHGPGSAQRAHGGRHGPRRRNRPVHHRFLACQVGRSSPVGRPTTIGPARGEDFPRTNNRSTARGKHLHASGCNRSHGRGRDLRRRRGGGRRAFSDACHERSET